MGKIFVVNTVTLKQNFPWSFFSFALANHHSITAPYSSIGAQWEV
jgi:hypothetical protein